MLLQIYKFNYTTCIVEIKDNSYKEVSKAFEIVEHPEFALNLKDTEELTIGKEYDLYDWDDIATEMVEQGKSNIFDVDFESIKPIGNVEVLENKFVWIDVG